MPSLRKRRARPNMKRKDLTDKSVPEDSITLDNYLVSLLREEEMIEAIGMVDPDKALAMGRKLEEDLHHPWQYVNKYNETLLERSLETFRKHRKEVKEAEEIEETDEVAEKKTPEDKAIEPASQSKDSSNRNSSNRDHSNKVTTTTTPTKKRRSRRPPSQNGTYTWSQNLSRVMHECKTAAGENALFKLADHFSIYRRRTYENQFYEVNIKREKESLRKPAEELAYRPFDAVGAFVDGRREALLKLAAKRIRIIVTEY
jgi:hypothetical protein